MPPQVHDRWPAPVRAAFAEMNRQLQQGDTAGVSAGCEQVVALLKEMDASNSDAQTRRQVAYAYFDLTYYFQQLGRTTDARWGYEQSRDRWAALPADFEALTQLASCHNHLGLIALNEGDLAAAETEFQAALAARKRAYQAQPDHPEQPDNMVFFAGVLCNLGTLYRQRGDRSEALRHYDQAIETLTAMLPKDEEPIDAEIREMHMNMWSQVYGAPHWVRTAQQFLANAQSGRTAVDDMDPV